MIRRLLLGIFLGGLISADPALAEDPNYVVTDIFELTDPDLSYVPTDFNNQRMVCGLWYRRAGGSGPETDRGIFIWRDGVVRHISPASGALSFVRSPESIVRMTNVRPDGTILLVAAALQVTNDSPNGPRNIIRTIRYTLEADLETYPQPVIAATALLGPLDTNVDPPLERNSGGGTDLDVTPDGYVIAEGALRSPAAVGFSQRWFASGLEEVWGAPFALDREGNAFGRVSANGNFTYETPLAGLSPQGGTSKTIWPIPAWPEQPTAAFGASSGLFPYAMNGPYRAALPLVNYFQTAVWTSGFTNGVIVPYFEISQGITASSNSRNALTSSGHLLGNDHSDAATGPQWFLPGNRGEGLRRHVFGAPNQRSTCARLPALSALCEPPKCRPRSRTLRDGDQR